MHQEAWLLHDHDIWRINDLEIFKFVNDVLGRENIGEEGGVRR